jgi:hypothetical protein
MMATSLPMNQMPEKIFTITSNSSHSRETIKNFYKLRLELILFCQTPSKLSSRKAPTKKD